MNILIKPISSSIYRKNKFFEINTLGNTFFGFNKRLKRLDITINTLDIGSHEHVDCIVFCDFPYPWEIDYLYHLIKNRKKSILFCFEPPVINPFNHRKIFFHLFHSVYTWNDLLIDNKKIKKFYLPVRDFYSSSFPTSFRKKKLLCIINSNKSSPVPFKIISTDKQDLYLERLRAIHFFEREAPEEFDLYGRGWNAPQRFSLKENLFGFKKYTSFVGPVPNTEAKFETLSKYKFNICFENCVIDGYVSEKIIDCFKANTVPIYWGAPNIEKYIPKDCFVDFRDFKDYAELLNHLQNMNERTYATYIKNGKKLLNTKKFQDIWFEEGFLKSFLDAISFVKNEKNTK
jgi:hypothetical protein